MGEYLPGNINSFKGWFSLLRKKEDPGRFSKCSGIYQLIFKAGGSVFGHTTGGEIPFCAPFPFED